MAKRVWRALSRLKLGAFSATLSVCTVLPACAQTPLSPDTNWPGSTPVDVSGEAMYLPDFSYAGYGFGVKALPDFQDAQIVDVDDFGGQPDDGKDDSRALLDAVAAANEINGRVVLRFSAGRYLISEIIRIERGDIVLRGMGQGSGGTELHFPRPLSMVDDAGAFSEIRDYLVRYDKRQREPERNIDLLFSEYSWTGGFIWIQKPGTRAASYLEELDQAPEKLSDVLAGRRGERTISVADTSRLSVGDAVQLQWFNREGEGGPLLREIYGDTSLDIGSHHWTFADRPLVRQTTRITAINGTDVELGDPLLHAVSSQIPSQLSAWPHLETVGIEDIHFSFPNAPSYGHHLEQGFNAVYFTSVIDGWMRDVRFTNADSGVLSYNSANLTFQSIRTEGERGAHYGVHLGNVHNVLVTDLVVANPVRHSLTFNTQSTRSVYQRATVLNASVLDQHAGANHQNLFDQVTLHISAERDERGPFYNVWDGSGARYWQPGHGQFNTTWNLEVIVEGGAERSEPVRLLGLAEGPSARIVGVHGNRTVDVEYFPQPFLSGLNETPDVPSLYDWQLAQRNVRDN